jgi:hypothetical protein
MQICLKTYGVELKPQRSRPIQEKRRACSLEAFRLFNSTGNKPSWIWSIWRTVALFLKGTTLCPFNLLVKFTNALKATLGWPWVVWAMF